MKIKCLNCSQETVPIANRCGICAERICRVCGCTDSAACFEMCFWLENGVCSNCGEGKQQSLSGKNIYICLGAPKHLAALQAIGNSGNLHESVWWTIRGTAEIGDKAAFYLTAPVSAIVGFGNVVKQPWLEEESKWKDRNFTEINRLRIFPEQNFIANRELRALFPEWIYWRQPRQSAKTGDDLKEPFWELLNERIQTR